MARNFGNPGRLKPDLEAAYRCAERLDEMTEPVTAPGPVFSLGLHILYWFLIGIAYVGALQATRLCAGP